MTLEPPKVTDLVRHTLKHAAKQDGNVCPTVATEPFEQLDILTQMSALGFISWNGKDNWDTRLTAAGWDAVREHTTELS